MLAEQPAQLDIVNRTPAKAVELARDFASAICQGGGLDLVASGYDMVINATSASLHDRIPELPDTVIGPNAAVCDLVYRDQPTIFLQWARAAGANQCIDGWGMLVEQAAESFELWRGVRPDTSDLVRNRLQPAPD